MTIALSEGPIKLIEAYIASGIFPGASFAILNKTSVQKYTMGVSRLKPEKLPLAADMAYDLASVSKVVGTGTVVINLILMKKIGLDDLLIAHYPDFIGDGAAKLTIRQLLTHTSGIDPFIKNRNALAYDALRLALNQVKATSEKVFHYSDVNFILLGFMLETLYGQSLSDILKSEIFLPFGMSHTGFVAPENTVATAWDLPKGRVHDPKAQVLGEHTGSAGLFSTVDDLVGFAQAYLSDDRYLVLLQDYSLTQNQRSLGWDLLAIDQDGTSGKTDILQPWLLHTGYTGTFVMLNLVAQQAIIFLSNRVHLKDDRLQWLEDRNLLIDSFVKAMKILENE
ncbi:serine hydrolase domain-containing protein [Lactococcus paracarnosus]|uniref:Beta-lactamase family protein n=1 Tax=Pseudolactococcus paracarnosus TaxID=2749962 RepID=A0A7L4WD25_9LACT|nr:serine hydrolase domain-containing protein [Lactococcus paracarnosus]SPC36704.1 Beta-lactamase, class C [Lactococcus piscium]MCJ1977512.1 beta-lactamase family protein [Lactococcus paracarnosus]MCJ1983655.1 beta-lactamase family protein [Lactococcus paracarnosus]MCJ1994033.1 beta-lactamase family protein [Lactococcus paracarnosus]MCJ1997729.1 beta-lactamase family protein [Lactococcus paracarnosus]